jgi:hypothetical protein
MTPHVIYIESDDGPPAAALLPHLRSGRMRMVRQTELQEADLIAASGLITTIYLDQIDFMMRKAALAAFLAAGRRLVFNGHVLHPFVDGLQPFRKLASQRRSDLSLERLSSHPVLEDIPVEAQQTQKGVAGFYGRGHNPPPQGAKHLTGIGPDRLPIDWEWLMPGGGGLFVHSGNDIWGTSDDAGVNALVATRLVGWAIGGNRMEQAA